MNNQSEDYGAGYLNLQRHNILSDDWIYAHDMYYKGIFITLMTKAEFKNVKKEYKRDDTGRCMSFSYYLNRGELCVTYPQLAEMLGISVKSKSTISSILKKLKNDGMISTRSLFSPNNTSDHHPVGTIITITYYDEYQKKPKKTDSYGSSVRTNSDSYGSSVRTNSDSYGSPPRTLIKQAELSYITKIISIEALTSLIDQVEHGYYPSEDERSVLLKVRNTFAHIGNKSMVHKLDSLGF